MESNHIKANSNTDESEGQNFKKKFINNRKTKSFGAINIKELLENKKNQNPQITFIHSNFQDKIRKKQDSDPINSNKVINTIINSSTNINTSINFSSHLQISKLYKDVKNRKYQTGGANKKYIDVIPNKVSEDKTNEVHENKQNIDAQNIICNLTTIKNEDPSLSLSISSLNNNLMSSQKDYKASKEKIEYSNNQEHKKFSSTKNNKILITINSSNFLENSSNSNSNKTQDTIVNMAEKNCANNSNVSLRDSIKSLQFNISINSNSPKNNPFTVYKHHLDSVRAITLSEDNSFLISAGDDLCINIWNFAKSNEIIKETKEPIISLRGHNNQIYTLESCSGYIFSSGLDGIIKQWKIPSDHKLQTAHNSNTFNYDPDIMGFEVTSWQAASDMIWCLKSHGNLLASVGCDGLIRVWKVANLSNKTEKKFYTYNNQSSSGLLCQLSTKNTKLNILEIPTSIDWESNKRLFSAYVSPIIKYFDLETKKSLLDISFPIEKSLLNINQQVNSISFNPDKQLLVTGHENKQIKFFDPRQNSPLIKSIVGHTDSISTITYGVGEYDLFSGCHDGTVRCWDIRNYNLLSDLSCHKQKYSEGVLSLKANKKIKSLLTSGADGIIKCFRYN